MESIINGWDRTNKKENGGKLGKKEKKEEKKSGRHMISNLVQSVSFRPLEVSIALEEVWKGVDESGLEL